MEQLATTTVTPPGLAGVAHLKTIVEGVPSLLEAIILLTLFNYAVNANRVGALYNPGSNVLILQAFVHP